MSNTTSYDFYESQIKILRDESGAPVKVEKRVKSQLRPVYLQLKTIEHPNLPKILDIREDGDWLTVTENYVPGISLKRYLIENGPQDDIFTKKCAQDISSALCAIHSLRPAVIHRDIKPENIICTTDGSFVLLDFDAARQHDPYAKGDTELIGTYGYAAPEQYGFAQTDERTDIYSLGVVLYEVRMGRICNKGDRCDGKLGKVIERCIAFDADRRYQSCRDLMRAINAAGSFKSIKFMTSAILCSAVLFAALIIALKGSKVGFTEHAQANTSPTFATSPSLSPIEPGNTATASPVVSLTPTLAPATPAATIQATPNPEPEMTPAPQSTPKPISTQKPQNEPTSGSSANVISGNNVAGCNCVMPDNVPDYSFFSKPGNLQIREGESITVKADIGLPIDPAFCTATEHSDPEYRYYLTSDSKKLGDKLDSNNMLTVSRAGTHSYVCEIKLNGKKYTHKYSFKVTYSNVESVESGTASANGCTCTAYWVDSREYYQPKFNMTTIQEGHTAVIPLEIKAAVDSSNCSASVHNTPVITFELSDSARNMGDTLSGSTLYASQKGEHVVNYYVDLNGNKWKNSFSITVNYFR